MAEKRKLRIGVFGGARGQTMISVLLHHPDAQLVAVCDKYVPLLDEAKKTAEECGTEIAVFERFDDFIEYDMDAVVLANYATEHATFAIRCMNKGKHVLSEVLPCETMAQAVELIETVEKTGLVYAYAENYCYMTHTFEMWRRYRTGEMGMALYGEGEYIHDCSAIWPQITYGERDHWRNRESPSFYNTHSLGPLITITGLRPIKVVGIETPYNKDLAKLGGGRGSGIEMVTLENGAVMKSIHGSLKREPGSVNYELYCERGMMETGRLEPLQPLSVDKGAVRTGGEARGRCGKALQRSRRQRLLSDPLFHRKDSRQTGGRMVHRCVYRDRYGHLRSAGVQVDPCRQYSDRRAEPAQSGGTGRMAKRQRLHHTMGRRGSAPAAHLA